MKIIRLQTPLYLQGLAPGCNEPLKPVLQLQRTSFGNNRLSRTSQSYDDLEDHYAALNITQSSRHGYAKIRPRNRPSLDTPTSKSQDMWAYKMDDSIVSPKYLFDHPVYASHSQLDAVPFLNKNLTSRSSNSAAGGGVRVNSSSNSHYRKLSKYFNFESKLKLVEHFLKITLGNISIFYLQCKFQPYPIPHPLY